MLSSCLLKTYTSPHILCCSQSWWVRLHINGHQLMQRSITAEELKVSYCACSAPDGTSISTLSPTSTWHIQKGERKECQSWETKSARKCQPLGMTRPFAIMNPQSLTLPEQHLSKTKFLHIPAWMGMSSQDPAPSWGVEGFWGRESYFSLRVGLLVELLQWVAHTINRKAALIGFNA